MHDNLMTYMHHIILYNITERAVFASCPQEYSGCMKEVSLSITTGNSATFNAFVTYTPGGSCDFKQEVTRIKLTKTNEVRNTLLFTCSTNHGATCYSNDHRLSMSRNNGLDFVFTLSNATADDSGAYEVVMEGIHPATNSLITVKKKFQLKVGMFQNNNITYMGISGPSLRIESTDSMIWYVLAISCVSILRIYLTIK